MNFRNPWDDAVERTVRFTRRDADGFAIAVGIPCLVRNVDAEDKLAKLRHEHNEKARRWREAAKRGD